MSEETQNQEELELPLEEIQYEEQADSTDIVVDENYTPVKDANVLLNPETGEVVDVKTLPPFERIKFVSERSGKKINDPDKSCKKCYGRGYVNIDVQDGVPTPCTCIFKDFYAANPYYKNVEYPSYNRKMRKQIEKQNKRKQLPNPALEKRQKKMNDLMKESIKKMLAKEASETVEVETESPEVVPFDGVESAEFTQATSEE
jgi:hypothetical protein